MDGNGHGTFCAGIVAGNTIGLAPNCSLFIGKVVNDKGVGTIDALVKGIDWAISNRCRVISLSVGTESCNPSLLSAIARAQEQNIHVICAAANIRGSTRVNIAFPARFGHVICVGSSDDNGNAPSYSSTGREIDFLAYGENIASSMAGYAGLTIRSGTSMAVPSVAGLIAVLMSHLDRTLVRLLRCAEMKGFGEHVGSSWFA